MSNISDKTLEKIKKEKITPKPKWQFLLKDSFLLTLFALMIVIGSISVSVMMYLSSNNDFELYSRYGKNILQYVLLSLPYVWFIALLVSLFLAVYVVRKMRGGYRFKGVLIVAFSVGVSIIAGCVLYVFGGGRVLDSIFYTNVPYYHTMHEKRMTQWERPEMGMLAGIIIEKNDEYILLESRGQDRWVVDVRDAQIKGKVPCEQGVPVRVVGTLIGPGEFKAEVIAVGGPGPNMRKGHKIMLERKIMLRAY
ncbi:hypothetical protein KKH43_02830 [Patescibacteria group bacterium]|nr:hypothetical protein [Patescibacteria group bacterium]